MSSSHLEPAEAACNVTAEHCRTEVVKLESLQRSINTSPAIQQVIGAVLVFHSHHHEIQAKLANEVFKLQNELTELRICIEDRDVH